MPVNFLPMFFDPPCITRFSDPPPKLLPSLPSVSVSRVLEHVEHQEAEAAQSRLQVPHFKFTPQEKNSRVRLSLPSWQSHK